MSHPTDPSPWPKDPGHRCTSMNGGMRCVLRPHLRGDHVGLEPWGDPNARTVWWDRLDRSNVTLADVELLSSLAPRSHAEPEGRGEPTPPWAERSTIEIRAAAGVPSPTLVPLEATWTGEICENCGSMRMLRTSKCSTCQDCGSSGGCG